ncbi:MAG: hypothetical protein E7389_07715 [Ruminococcaceae bacterium]|nr:hypothetical protein [Oscillospiraceae bacterium]
MATKKKTEKDNSDYYKQLVPVTLVKDNNNYKDDVTITYNGKNYQIQRGVQVEVPLFIKLILEDGYRQQMEADAYSEKLSHDFSEKTEKIGG